MCKHRFPYVHVASSRVVKLADGSTQLANKLVEAFSPSPAPSPSTSRSPSPSNSPSPLQKIVKDCNLSNFTSISTYSNKTSETPLPAKSPIELCHVRARDIKQAWEKNGYLLLLLHNDFYFCFLTCAISFALHSFLSACRLSFLL